MSRMFNLLSPHPRRKTQVTVYAHCGHGTETRGIFSFIMQAERRATTGTSMKVMGFGGRRRDCQGQDAFRLYGYNIVLILQPALNQQELL